MLKHDLTSNISPTMKFSFPFFKCFSCNSDKVVSTKGQGGEVDQYFRVFFYHELRSATNGFCSKNKIGEGGFGIVYKGELEDGTIVAIKVLSVELESMRGEREFISELAALANIKHEYLITLVGCCVDGAKRFLVYHHMENNSLSHTFLGEEQNRVKFSWARRRDIMLGVARGLAYLHEEINPHIIHRDIKASNILLDQNFNPKVGDFGLSKLFRGNTSHISTRVAGTLGYISPEYAITGHLSRKSDIYSFGVLLLEVISGRSVVDYDIEFGEQFLVGKAWEMYIGDKLLELVDPTLNGDFPKEAAVRFLKVGLLCVQEMTKVRPRMSIVIKMLNDEIDTVGIKILEPGFVADLMDVKIRHKKSLHGFSSR